MFPIFELKFVLFPLIEMTTEDAKNLENSANNLPNSSLIESSRGQALDTAVDEVFGHKDHYLPPGVCTLIQGFDFNQWKGTGDDYSRLLASFATTGFQATHLAQAIDSINAMV